MATLEHAGAQLSYEVRGDGEPLTLVHGTWSDHHNWDAVVPLLETDFRVLVYDRRGHSASTAPPGPGSIDDDVADLAALIEHEGLAPTHLMGNSFGANVALRLAASAPDLVRTLVVHEPLLPDLLPAGVYAEHDQEGDRVAAVADLLRAGRTLEASMTFVDDVALGPGSWERLPPPIQERFLVNAPTFLDEFDDQLSHGLDGVDLGCIRAPVLLSGGEVSEPYFALILDVLEGQLPTASRQVLAGAGHVPNLTHPAELAAALVGFMR